jgi:hypothetical protein
MTRKLILAFFLCFCGLQAFSEEVPKTLAGFRLKYLNQRVIIDDVPFLETKCLQWMVAVQKPDGSYKESDFNLPIQYRGQTGTIIAIQLAPPDLQRNQVGTKNAFGETAGEADISDPYLDVVAKFGDEKIGIVRNYPENLVPDTMALASSRAIIDEELEAKLPSLVGQKLYASGYSKLYKPTSTIEELSGSNSLMDRIQSSEIPLLEPLTITKVKYLPEQHAVIFKLALPDKSEGIIYTDLHYLFPDRGLGIAVRIRDSSGFETSIPNELDADQINAIKHRSPLKGMTLSMVERALGFEQSENDWGSGGKQLVYFDGKLLIYLDTSGKVVDWQSLN